MAKPKKTDDTQIAAVLAHGDLHDDTSASKRFGVSPRTIQRWRAAVRDGRLPAVAELVAKQKDRALEKHADLLEQTFGKALAELQKKLPDGNLRQVVGAVKVVGELLQRRDFLKDEDDDGEQPRVHSTTPGAANPTGPAPGRAPGAAPPTGHQPPREPVH